MNLKSVFAKIFNYLKYLGLAILLSSLMACGTLTRFKSKEPTFRGLDSSNALVKKVIYSDSLGAPFIFMGAILGYPVDLVFDIALYPIDKGMDSWVNYKANKAHKKRQQEFLEKNIKLNLIAINETLLTVVKYKIIELGKYYSFTSCPKGDTSCCVSTVVLPKTYNSEQKVTIVWSERAKKEKTRNPHKQDSVEWQKYHDERGADDIYYKTTVALPSYNKQTKYLIPVFLPCQQVLFLATNETPKWDWRNIPYQQKFKQLKKLEESKQCPVVTPELSSEWSF